jgi:hypothetical protein
VPCTYHLAAEPHPAHHVEVHCRRSEDAKHSDEPNDGKSGDNDVQYPRLAQHRFLNRSVREIA